jgi:hypothetical protein
LVDIHDISCIHMFADGVRREALWMSDEKHLLINALGDKRPGAIRSRTAFHGPTPEGWAAFGWQALKNAPPPSRSKMTVTSTFHRPRRIR